MKKIIVDLDGTLTVKKDLPYSESIPNTPLIEKLSYYKKCGYEIIIFTARNMRTYRGNVGKINVHTLPGILEWLDLNQVPYDQVIVGKPWCGTEGFYVDDRAVRPAEFVNLTEAQLQDLVQKDEKCI